MDARVRRHLGRGDRRRHCVGDLIAVDLFAGGGGASEGIRRALGVSPLIAVNHCDHAIEMHAKNHPQTRHIRESVWDVKPWEAVRLRRGQRVDLLWASPDCTHFSRARGGKPREKSIRSLAWVIVEWAATHFPTVICLENVPEFTSWGPLGDDGQPDRSRAGETFAEFVGRLHLLGYRVEHRVLCAADYGAPTSRKRLFMIARNDGQPIVWPAPTHGPGRAAPHRSAAECLDWSIPCPSIFERKKPLAEATQRRIAEGIRRYVLEAPRPFLVGDDATAAASSLIHVGNGERVGQAPRVYDPRSPLGTIVAGGGKHALVAAFLAKHYTGVVGQPLSEPTGTITAIDHHSVVAAHLTKFFGTSTGSGLDAPLPTITAGGRHHGLVAAFLTKFYSQGSTAQSVDEPLHTIVSKARFGLVSIEIDGEQYALVDIGMRMLSPRELARAQGFGENYILTGTQTDQIARIGNSVPPQVVAAIVAAQFPPRRAVA